MDGILLGFDYVMVNYYGLLETSLDGSEGVQIKQKDRRVDGSANQV